MVKNIMLFWSGGKDSGLALKHLRENPDYQVIGLISTIDKESNQIPFHGVKEGLLKKQAELLDLPLQRIYLPSNCSNEEYEKILSPFLERYKAKGIMHMAFGDLYLEDVKAYRELFFKRLGLTPIFPLWKKDLSELINEFCESQMRAVITSVMPQALGSEFINKEYGRDVIAKFPVGVCPMGENGEFHTFLSFGPGFKTRVPYSKGLPQERGPYLVGELKDP